MVWAIVYHEIEPSERLKYDSLVEGAVVQLVCGVGGCEGRVEHEVGCGNCAGR
ncbi:MAG: hypothetical protein ACI8V2_001699 [Candidatus Latescibacterota bacterium]|jgi:hypothetical protein